MNCPVQSTDPHFVQVMVRYSSGTHELQDALYLCKTQIGIVLHNARLHASRSVVSQTLMDESLVLARNTTLCTSNPCMSRVHMSLLLYLAACLH